MLWAERHQRDLVFPMPVGFAICLYILGVAYRAEFQPLLSVWCLKLNTCQAAAFASHEVSEDCLLFLGRMKAKVIGG